MTIICSEWEQVPVSAVATVLLGGTPSRSVPEYWHGDIKWASARDVVTCDTRYLRDTRETVTPLGVENSAAKVLGKDTIVVTARGTVGEVRMLGESMAFNQTCYGLVANQGVDPAYLYYTLKASMRQMRALSYGTVFDTITMKTFDALMVPYPSLPEQRAIASILGALDDKIELNRQMNQTFEEMAQAIFKNWFVDFEPFREEGMQDSPLGPIPKGWRVLSIKDIAGRVGMGPFGSSIKVSTFVPDGIPIISGQHLNHTLLEDNHYNFITLAHAEKLKSSNVFRGDIVFTHAGNIGQVAYIPETSQYERYVISQRQFYMRCDLTKISPLFVIYFFKTPQGQHSLLANTSSTGVPSISQPVSYLKTIKLQVPTKPLIDAFDEVVRKLHLQISNNILQAKTLSAIRDALLPKLLSGKIRVKDAEKYIEERT